MKPNRIKSTKSKDIAAIIALFLGPFAVHKFYLGESKEGFIQVTFVVIFTLGIILAISTQAHDFYTSPLFIASTLGVSIVGFKAAFDSIILAYMSDHDFNQKYNK
ncbi:MAG: TM2 domain-containing protein [Gloeobacterales cyanobacterium]